MCTHKLNVMNHCEVLDIWIGYFENNRYEIYFQENYEDCDDIPISEFADDQGELWIDHDFMEEGFVTSPDSIAELAAGFSWSEQYVAELTDLAVQRGISRFNTFVFLVAGQVEHPKSITKEGIELHFMGKFPIRTNHHTNLSVVA